MDHINVGKDLILKISDIRAVNLHTKDNKDNVCIKLTLVDGTIWSIYSNLVESRQRLLMVLCDKDIYDTIKLIRDTAERSGECKLKYKVLELIN